MPIYNNRNYSAILATLQGSENGRVVTIAYTKLNIRTGFPTVSSTSTKCTKVIPRFNMALRCSKMAPSVQMFPSITISKNEHPSNFYSKRSTPYVQETREKLRPTINQFQKNYPVLISVYTGNNTTRTTFNSLIRKNSNAWSYKTGKSSETRKTETKRKIPNVEEVLQENIPERKLWSPKDNKKSRDLGIQVAPRILEARHRRQQYTKNVAERTQSGWSDRTRGSFRNEKRGKSECLDKMEGQQILPRGSIKNNVIIWALHAKSWACIIDRIYSIQSRRNDLLLLHIRIKIIHLIGWTLSTWPSLFRDID